MPNDDYAFVVLLALRTRIINSTSDRNETNAFQFTFFAYDDSDVSFQADSIANAVNRTRNRSFLTSTSTRRV